MTATKFCIPKGTLITQTGSSVTIVFHFECQADAFVKWLKWLDTPEAKGTAMLVEREVVTKE